MLNTHDLDFAFWNADKCKSNFLGGALCNK